MPISFILTTVMTKITINQALLLLIDRYKNVVEYKDLFKLKQLFLVGIQSDEDSVFLNDLLKDPLLSEYVISYEFQKISKDPSRRYFESHLAYNTLKAEDKEDKIFHKILFEVHLNLYEKLSNKEKYLHDICFDSPILKSPFTGDEIYEGYKSIDLNPHFRIFTSLAKEKIRLLFKIWYLALVLKENLPHPSIYSEGFFSQEQRGIIKKLDQKQVISPFYGLVNYKIPSDDILFDLKPALLRPSGNSTFDEKAKFIIEMKKRLVHPFSNSISGTMLIILRSLCYLNNLDKLPIKTKESLNHFIKLITSLILYNSGGHTLYEFAAVFTIPAVQTIFGFIDKFNEIDLTSVYLYDNEIAFEKSLEETLKYNRIIIQNLKLHDEVVAFNALRGTSINPDAKYLDFKNYYRLKWGSAPIKIFKSCSPKTKEKKESTYEYPHFSEKKDPVHFTTKISKSKPTFILKRYQIIIKLNDYIKTIHAHTTLEKFKNFKKAILKSLTLSETRDIIKKYKESFDLSESRNQLFFDELISHLMTEDIDQQLVVPQKNFLV